MKRTIHTLCTAALLLAATACEDTLQTEGPAATGDGPTLTLRIDNSGEDTRTRTTLDSADPKHNVQSIRILIFRGEGDDATFFAAEEAKWPATEGGERPNSMTYTLQEALVAGQTYTLLGVGMDNTFEDTYTIDENQTLDQTYARLKANQSPARCEFFTGSVTFTHQGKQTQIDDLHIRRRVAGVMLYVKEIPQKLVENDGNTYRVTSVRLYLGSAQNTSVRLKRSEEGREPNGQTPGDEASKLLTSVTVPDGIYDAQNDFYKDGNAPLTLYSGVYMLPLNRKENTPTFTVQLWGKQDNKDGTLADEEQALSKTFVVENRSEGSATSFDIRSNYIYCIGKKSQNTDQPISLGNDHILLEVQPWKEITPNVDFDEARIQAIFDPDFDEEKYRFNCINGTFTVRVLPSLFQDHWTLTIPNTTTAYDKDFTQKEFTTAGDNPTMTHWLYILTDDDGHLSKTGTKAKTTYQCTPEEAKNGAEVTFVMLDYAVYRPWGWVDHQWKPTPDDITRINNDVRSIEIMLQTDRQITGEDGNRTTSPRYDYLPITQYNTITVDLQSSIDNDDNEIATCGFSRLDWGDRFVKFPTENSVVENDPEIDDTKIVNDYGSLKEGGYKSSGWGWWTTAARTLYGDDFQGSKSNGAENTQRIGTANVGSIWEASWPGSALGKCEVRFKREENGVLISATPGGTNKTTNQCWYLPAQYEMEGLYRASLSSPTLEVNSTTTPTLLPGSLAGVAWWTSTLARIGSSANMRAIYLPVVYDPSRISIQATDRTAGDKNTGDGAQGDGSFMYMRQARKFTQYYNGSDWATLPDGQQQ